MTVPRLLREEACLRIRVSCADGDLSAYCCVTRLHVALMTHGCPGRANAGTESQLTIPSAWESQGALAGLTRRSPYKTFQKKQRCTQSRTHQARGFCTSAGLLCHPEVRARGGPTLLGTWGLGTAQGTF